MLISVFAIGIALFFNNIDKFKRFKLKGTSIEAELKTAVNEAYAAIEQLKELGLALSSPIVSEITVSGSFLQFIHLKHKFEQVAQITDTLKKLGASKEEIEDVCTIIYLKVTNDHKRKILYSLKAANLNKSELFKGIDDGKMDDWDKGKIENFIEENSLIKNNDTDEWFLDLDFFCTHNKLRRDDKW